MTTVKSDKLGVLPILIFQQVLKNIITQFSALGITAPLLVATFNALRVAYVDLDNAMKKAQGSVNTAALLALDEQRDNLIRGLAMILNGYALSTTVAKANAAHVLLHYFNAYGDYIADQAQITETSTINNLLQDFQRPDAVAAAAQIPLADWTGPLATVNGQFETLYSTRAADLNVPVVGLAKKYRVTAQQRFEDFVNRLNGAILAVATPDPAHEKAANMINVEVETAKTDVKKGGGGNAGGAPATPTPPTP